jgi:hypothetical protein
MVLARKGFLVGEVRFSSMERIETLVVLVDRFFDKMLQFDCRIQSHNKFYRQIHKLQEGMLGYTRPTGNKLAEEVVADRNIWRRGR